MYPIHQQRRFAYNEKGLVGEHLADHAFGLLLTLTRQLAALETWAQIAGTILMN